MANKSVDELRKKTDAAWANLTRQLPGMEAHMDRADAPGQWTTREVLTHLLFEPGWKVEQALKAFTDQSTLPVFDLKAGAVNMTPDRKAMTLKQFVDALDAQRRGAYQYLESLPEAELQRRKVRIPLFKQFMDTDEISLAMFTGAMLDYHWNDHAGQLAKIRKAAGLPDAK
jgi:hypothetical protein